MMNALSATRCQFEQQTTRVEQRNYPGFVKPHVKPLLQLNSPNNIADIVTFTS